MRNLTCIVCPRGCDLCIKFDEAGKIESITGNGCKRGIVYAENECTHPVRTVTTTVRCADGRIIPVKTANAVPKEKVFEVMRSINSVRPMGKISIGDVIIENVADTGISVVAAANG